MKADAEEWQKHKEYVDMKALVVFLNNIETGMVLGMWDFVKTTGTPKVCYLQTYQAIVNLLVKLQKN